MISKKALFYLLIFGLPFSSFAQQQNNGIGTFSIAPAFELLRSTHSNLFYSPSLKINYLFENGFEPGLGMEYATTPLHIDNGFILHRLKFFPIYGNLKYNFGTSKKITPYAESSLGISFNKYDIAADSAPDIKSKVKEEGFYVYGGFGAKYKVTQGFNAFLAVGFKGYKMSTNDLDINPHGLSFMLGLNFY